MRLSLFMFAFLMQFENYIFSRNQQGLNFDERFVDFDENDNLELKKMIIRASYYYFEIIKSFKMVNLDERKKNNIIQSYKEELYKSSRNLLQELQSKDIYKSKIESFYLSDKTALYKNEYKDIKYNIKNVKDILYNINNFDFRKMVFISDKMYKDFNDSYFALYKNLEINNEQLKIQNNNLNKFIKKYYEEIINIKYFIIKHELSRSNSYLTTALNVVGIGSVSFIITNVIIYLANEKIDKDYRDHTSQAFYTVTLGGITYYLCNMINFKFSIFGDN